MGNEEKILEMLTSLQKDISAIREDVSGLKEGVSTLKDDMAELKEEHQITRDGVNKLLEWSETAGYIIHFPLDKAK